MYRSRPFQQEKQIAHRRSLPQRTMNYIVAEFCSTKNSQILYNSILILKSAQRNCSNHAVRKCELQYASRLIPFTSSKCTAKWAPYYACNLQFQLHCKLATAELVWMKKTYIRCNHHNHTMRTVAPWIQQHQQSKKTFPTLWEATLNQRAIAEHSRPANMKW